MDFWKVIEILGGGVQLAELGYFEYAFEDYILWPAYFPSLFPSSLPSFLPPFLPSFVPGYHEVNIPVPLCPLGHESQVTMDRNL